MRQVHGLRASMGSGGLAFACVALACLAIAVPAAIGYENGSLGVRGMSEMELREAEQEILGPAHAAEHARQRKIAREEEGPEPFASMKAGTPEPTLAAYDPSDPAQAGSWNPPFSVPITATHAVLLPTGKVMWWSFPNGFKSSNSSQAWLWDPATGQSNRVDPPLWRDPADGQLKPANIWCSGQSLLADGRVLVTGGNLSYTGGTPNFKGLNKVYTFNPFNETWTEQPDMPHGRWYPSQKLLPDGRVLIMSGFDENGFGASNLDVEVFTPSPDMNGVGTLTKIGSRGGAGNPPDGELYPHMFVMPSGRTLVAGPDPSDSWWFNTIGPSTFTWSDIPNPSQSRLWGAAVHTPGDPSSVTLTGGKNWSTGPTLASSSIYDEAAPGLGWQSGASLNVARAHLNTVLMPDGAMAVFGGGVGKRAPEGQWAADPEHRQVELFDPATNSWRLGPSQAKPRAYHSTAVLLPDGRVISAGSEDILATAGADTAEIYEPPYLFRGPRPEVDSAPTSVSWADEFGVASDSDVSRATLLAPAATTHANDMNQRYIELEVTEDLAGVGLNVRAPADNLVAQPGYYMLFLLNGDGVPSVAHWIRLDGAAPDRPRLDPGPPPPPDAPPTAIADAATLNEDAAATTIDVLANDTNPDGGPKTIESASDPDHGTVAITGGGTGLTYRPDADFCGPDDFSYTLNGGSSAAVAITVSCVEDDPTAVADSATVAEDSGATTINVRANDTDPDGGAMAIGSATDPAHGSVTVAADGLSLAYTPDANYCGADTFTYALNGGSSATVSITVDCVDDSPTAVNDSATKAEDSGATAIGVLANDTDIDGGTKSIQSASDPAHGTTAVTGGGAGLTYAPDADYCGPDSFTYGLSGGSEATVSVTVTCVDDNPTALNDSATVNEDVGATSVDVLGNDTDIDGGTKSIQSASDPAHGTTAVTGGGTGLTYRPDADYCGSDSFNYTLNGGSSATVAVTVSCADDNPTAVADTATVSEDSGATTINVRSNDTDPDGGTKTISSATDPAKGTVEVAADGLSLTYRPDANYCNTGGTPDTFSYTLNGGSTAQVSVTVTCVDDAPTAVADSATVSEDAVAALLPVLGNDTDIDGGTKSIQSASDPAHGTTATTGGGSGLTYAPDSNYCGPDSFTYTLNGGSSATVSVTVSCVDDNPVAVADSATVTEDSGPSAIDALANDTDIDGGPKTISSASDAPHGTASITGGGTGLTYTPDADYCGADSFTYALNGGSTATVSITVSCVGDLPVAVNDSATRGEDSGAGAIDVLANDTDVDGGPKNIQSASDPAHGTTVVTGGGAGLTYAPDPNYCGADSFTYALNGDSTATVSVTVTCVDDAPTAVADSSGTFEDAGSIWINALANDSDVDGGTKTIVSISDPPHGTAGPSGGGISYTPDFNYCGADSFSYSVNGGSTATVSIMVICVDDPPTALNDAATVAQNASATPIYVLANDPDPDGGPKMVVAASAAAHGSVAVASGGQSVTYRPDRDYCGSDSFTYTLNGGSSASVAVTIKRGKRKCRK